MAFPRWASRIAVDDHAVAGVVGFVLVLAAAVTYYSYAAQNEVPRIGTENERAWDAEVGSAITRLSQGAGERADSVSGVREVLPPAPEAPTQSIPLLAPLRSARASGSLSYTEDCAAATLTHYLGTVKIVDLVDGAHGCITFRGDTIYAEAFAYHIELGGVLRIQGERAAVLAGPTLDVDSDHIALTLIDLRGTSQTLGVDRANSPISLSARPGALEVGASTNSDLAAWTLTTSYPEAWADWYTSRFEAAGVPVTTGITCTDPLATGPARGPCDLEITLPGATSIAISYGRYDVNFG